ncbi:hypothetical protein [Phreatobacter stygius]|uniref:DUF3035 domain-containing protein n=1 Tax=Phreatobacter stygius TaxID=1940610 RepID=A0A4D7BLF5_9HYPH|nr:hypothetical protein [Phreatobacter stygius]QCI68557.1 hypothetical protein E8M01_32600 [Phreatobacter stygius]
MREMTDQTATIRRRSRAGLAAFALAALALGGCQTANDGYPSPYGPSRRVPLPAVAGGGLWQPQPIRATGYGAATLISRLPEAPRVPAPARSSETPELLTPAQEAARRGELQTARGAHSGAMDRRLTSSGRIRGPDPGSRPAIEEDRNPPTE